MRKHQTNQIENIPQNNYQHWFLNWILNQKEKNSGKTSKIQIKFDI